MFRRSFGRKNRVGKISKPMKTSFKGGVVERMFDKAISPQSAGASPNLTSAIISIMVGKDKRLFAAHEDVLSCSPLFAAMCQGHFFDSEHSILLPDEEPEIFSCVLEYLYKGDYYPRLICDKRRNTWMLEGDENGNSPQLDNHSTHSTGGRAGQGVETVLFHPGAGGTILRETAVYCAADRYGLDELKRLALRKQGLQSGVDVATILRSAQYAYEHTPDSDSRLRAYYLALIIRSRKTFKRSGTMQLEMETGGKLFFDLFCSMANYIDDLEASSCKGTPKSV